MLIEINNLKGSDVELIFIETVLKKSVDFLKQRKIIDSELDFDLSVAFVNSEEIRKHNANYRGKDEPTDVLSFRYELEDGVVSGELILCPDIIKKYAKEDGIDYLDEVTKNLIHGFLLIVGYEHGNEMFDLQKAMIKKVKIK